MIKNNLIVCLLVSLCLWQTGIGKNICSFDTLIVERWRMADIGVNKGKVEVLDRRVFNQKMLLLSYVQLSGCFGRQVVDSIVYNYDLGNRLIEQIEYTSTDSLINDCQFFLKENTRIKYVYNDKGILIRTITYPEMTESSSFEISNPFFLADSLKLLEDYFSDILIVKEVIKNRTNYLYKNPVNIQINKEVYSDKSPSAPGILSNIGIPRSEPIKSMILHYTNKRQLVVDEFDFIHYKVRRKYQYKGGLPVRIRISVKNKKDNTQVEYIEGYKYKSVKQ